MPTQDPEGREVPCGLRLEHEQHPRDDEAGAADDLRGPEDAVEGALGEAVVDAGEGGEAGDPEDGGAEELCGGGEEAEFVEVVRAQGGEGGEPDPGARGWGAGCVGVRGWAGVEAVGGRAGQGEGGGPDWLSLVWNGRRKENTGGGGSDALLANGNTTWRLSDFGHLIAVESAFHGSFWGGGQI